MPNETPDEIDVTEILERIDTLEKENHTQAEKIEALERAAVDAAESIDKIAKYLSAESGS